MKRGTLFGILALLAALFVAPGGALAGGWATVTLDSLPADVRAGEAFEVGFTVRQHGATPTNQVEPTVALTDPATKKTIYFSAEQRGETGHFVAAVTIPSAGAWEWEIIPAPFAGTQLVALNVAPASAPAPAAQPAPAPAAQPAAQPASGRSPALWWASGGLLLAAAATTALLLRQGGRRRAANAEAAGRA